MLTNTSKLTFTPCLVNKWFENMLTVTIRECVECRGGRLEETATLETPSL